MKRKPLIVLLVLLLVGILAFTVFACNNNQNGGQNNNNNNNNNDDDDDDNNGNEDEEEITYEIVKALPKLVTGIDKVAAKVADVNEGKAAYLGADINLALGVTAEKVKAIDLNLGLSLKVSVDQDDSANSWALIGLTSGGDEIAQIYLAVEGGKEHIYVKEALTGASNWKLISVLDTAETGLEGLFTGKNNGLINKLFGFISSFVGAEKPLINFDSATPISSIELMKGLSLNTILGLVDTLDLGKTLDGVLHAEAYDDGSGYTAELNRAGIGDLLTKLGPTIKTFAPDLDLYGTLRGLNPILSMVLGMSVDENEDTFIIDDKANPKLTIDFSLNDDAALENLSINFNNPDIEGLGIELKFAISNIELGGESKESDVKVSGYDNLGLNLAVEAKLPKWEKAATVAVSVNPNAVIGWDANGKIKFDLSGIEGHATFNGATIAQYTGYNGAVAEFKGEKGFAIDLGPVYDFIAPSGTDDQRDNVYFINCDLAKIVASAMNPSTASAASELSNAAYADEVKLTGTLGKLITAIKAGVKLTNIGDVIGPILTDSNNLVGMLLDLLGTNGAIGLVPALGKDPNGDISVTVDADKLVDFAMDDNLLGGIESMIKIELYDASNPASGIQPPKTLSDIFEGDLVDVLIDLVYTAMYEGAQNDKTNPYTGTFAQYMEGKITPTEIVDGIIKTVAEKWNITALKDGALKVSEIGDIVASIKYGGKDGTNGISAKLELLGAYVKISADLDKYVAPADIDLTNPSEVLGDYTDAGVLVVNFKDSQLKQALLELAVYALGMDVTA